MMISFLNNQPALSNETSQAGIYSSNTSNAELKNSNELSYVFIGVFVVVMRAVSSEDTTLSSIFPHLVAFQCAFCCIRALFIFDIEFISHFWLIVVFVYSTLLRKKAGCNCHHWVGTLRWRV
jgi:hypothetical protein